MDRLDFDPGEMKRMATGATQIRICTGGSGTDCVESKPDSFPIKMLREGKAVSHNDGASQSIDEIEQVWSGPDARLAALTSTCTTNEGDADIMFESSKEGSYFYHACGNYDGLHISVHSGGYCTWDVTPNNAAPDLEVFINVPGPTTCTDLSCDIASYNGVDELKKNPHYVSISRRGGGVCVCV